MLCRPSADSTPGSVPSTSSGRADRARARSERSNTMCAAIGVTTMDGTERDDDRSAGAERVRGRARGRRRDHPVGGERRHVGLRRRTPRAGSPVPRALLDDDLVQRPLRLERRALDRLDVSASRSSIRAEPSSMRSSSAVASVGFDLGQEPDPADLHAQHRDTRDPTPRARRAGTSRRHRPTAPGRGRRRTRARVRPRRRRRPASGSDPALLEPRPDARARIGRGRRASGATTNPPAHPVVRSPAPSARGLREGASTSSRRPHPTRRRVQRGTRCCRPGPGSGEAITPDRRAGRARRGRGDAQRSRRATPSGSRTTPPDPPVRGRPRTAA